MASAWRNPRDMIIRRRIEERIIAPFSIVAKTCS
jgi:hypothetical protein